MAARTPSKLSLGVPLVPLQLGWMGTQGWQDCSRGQGVLQLWGLGKQMALGLLVELVKRHINCLGFCLLSLRQLQPGRSSPIPLKDHLASIPRTCCSHRLNACPLGKRATLSSLFPASGSSCPPLSALEPLCGHCTASHSGSVVSARYYPSLSICFLL